jgi:hypothetical protein
LQFTPQIAGEAIVKIFISWSGARSEALASALREWFPLILHYVDPWLSKSDIQAGERWSIEIAKELEACNFGIICVTRENVGAPWILFEAGALAKSMQDGRVIPLLLDLDVKDISGPLAQFQAKKVDNAGIRELALSLNKASTAPVPEIQLDKLIAALWGDLEKQINAIPKSGTPARHTRPQGEILEELVSSIRNVEMRFRDAVESDSPKFRRRHVRFHPMLIRDIARSSFPGDPIQFLVAASMFRDEAPWIYELALETYRALKSENYGEAQETRERAMQTLESIMRGPFSEVSGMDRRSMHEMFDVMMHMWGQLEIPIKGRKSVRKRIRTRPASDAKTDSPA